MTARSRRLAVACHRPFALLLACGVLGFAGLQPAQSQGGAQPKTFEKDVLPSVTRLCVTCHTGKEAAGSVNLATFKTKAHMVQNPSLWERVARNLKSGAMPPKGMPQPTPAERKFLIEWIESTLAKECNLDDPGRITIRRLNRTEYDNTIRDLTGVDFEPGDDFPNDDVGYGFDNIGDVLSVSPLLMEKYLDAAWEVASRAVQVPEKRVATLDVGAMRLTGGVNLGGNGLMFFSNGEAAARYEAKVGGEHKVTVLAGASKAGPELAKMEVLLDDVRLGVVDVAAEMGKPASYTFPTSRLERKVHTIRVRFLNDYYNQESKSDRNLGVHSISVSPPAPGGALQASHRRIVGDPPIEGKEWETALARLRSFAQRAFRRPPLPEELERVYAVAQQVRANREPYEAWIQVGVAAILASPSFLFRTELDPVGKTGSRALNDWEIASRLSYFLWSTMPDQALFDLAAQGKLKDRQVLVAQVRRMVADPKSIALAENFGGQWLELRKLETAAPDPKLFPGYTDRVKEAMIRETTLFFDEIARRDRSVLDFLEGKFAVVNEDLARLYGIPGVAGPEFRKVPVSDPNRAGVLTQASVLTLTSNPTRTSPVKRGKWVLEVLLGTPPPPPPPGASQLSEDREKIVGKTLRQRMEMHRKDPNCATCHQRMDPIGFGLENFDGVGRWRTVEEGTKVDATGVLPGGQKFDGPVQLRAILAARKTQFVEALAEKMLVYATGRGLTANDKCFVEDIRKRVESNQYKFGALVAGVVLSEPFLSRTMGAAK